MVVGSPSRTFDCRIHSQIAGADVEAGGLLVSLCVGGGACG
eukprot:COSAG02_NODE_9953_length_2066_cov_1.258261_3_plen_40_part_01